MKHIIQQIENSIIQLQDKFVIIDKDIAKLYGVETRRINEAVKNNPDKFPEGYILQLSKLEKDKVVENFDHLEALKFSPNLPKVFTEKGLYMLATILKSPIATETTIAIIEAFAKLRELKRVIKKLSDNENEESKESLLEHSGNLFAELLDDDLTISETETSIELNFAIVKFKHTIKAKK